MINDLIEVSINVLPSLARGDGVGFMNKEELDGYKAMLLSGKARLVEEILKILMVDREVSQVELTQKICDPSNVLSKLLWSYGIRSMAKKHSTH